MRMDKFTTLAQEAIAAASQNTLSKQHAELTPLHLLDALLEDQNGIACSIISKAGIQVDPLVKVVTAEIGRLPTVSGTGTQPVMSTQAAQVLTVAGKSVV